MNLQAKRCHSACEPMSTRSAAIVLAMLVSIGLVAVGQKVLSQNSQQASASAMIGGSTNQMFANLPQYG